MSATTKEKISASDEPECLTPFCVLGQGHHGSCANEAELRRRLRTEQKERYELDGAVSEVEAQLAAAERKLTILSIASPEPPTDEKLQGIVEHAAATLETFMGALLGLSDITKGKEERGYMMAQHCKDLIANFDAIMFLDERYRPKIDDLLPALHGLVEIEGLGWLSDRYGRSHAESCERFLALEIVRRTVGLPKRKADPT